MEDRFLFKAKRIDNGEWVTGYYVVIGDRNVIIEKCAEDYYCTDDGEVRHGNQIHEVNPKTICQCTGLKDDNWNLIYENDILLLKDEINGCKWKAVVEFGNPTGEYNWGWQLVQVTECEANKDILLWIETEMSYMDAKIIGNTIDNLELVESEE